MVAGFDRYKYLLPEIFSEKTKYRCKKCNNIPWMVLGTNKVLLLYVIHNQIILYYGQYEKQ